MRLPQSKRGFSKVLLAIAGAVVCVASLVIWFGLDATRQVSSRTEKLVEVQIPELRAIGLLQDTVHRRVLNLYLYYATMKTSRWREGERLAQEMSLQLGRLARIQTAAREADELRAATDRLNIDAQRFHQEMSKGRGRDWDVLREHLASAQVAADDVDARLEGWAETIRSTVGAGGRDTRREVARLNTVQIGFSAAMLLVVLFALGMLAARARDQEELRRQAYFDGSTGLPNRRRMEADWMPAGNTSLLLVKLDRYPMLTATFGHSVVEMVTQMVVTRLQRAIDIQRGEARLYQFAPATWLIQIRDNDDRSAAELLAEMTVRTSLKPLLVDGRELMAKISVGVTFHPDHGDHVEALLRNADSALRAAQLAGGSRVAIYDHDMQRRAEQFLSIETALRTGLHDGEFELFYQPKVDGTDLSCVSAEALLRWRHDGDLVAPGEFIPIAEESGLILDLGRWVIDEACRQWRAWDDDGSPRVPLAVNVSALQFQSDGFAEEVSNSLKRYSIPDGMLELEITEEATFGNPEGVTAALYALKAVGVTLAIDDFGTGYSSLAYLKAYPFDVLKIDRAFINGMENSARDLSIVNMMVMLGKRLDFKVVAEGVETQAQQEHLQEIGCDLLQGFLYSKPLPASRFASYLRTARGASDISAGTAAG